MELHAQLDDMRDRYHEASGEADRLHDRIDHAPQYGRISDMIREHHRQKREAARPLPWLVVITREQTPEVTVFSSYAEALAFFERAQLQWSESYLAVATKCPSDWVGTP